MKRTQTTLDQAIDRVYGLINEKRKDDDAYQFSENKIFSELMSAIAGSYAVLNIEYETSVANLPNPMISNRIDIQNLFFDGGQPFIEHVKVGVNGNSYSTLTYTPNPDIDESLGNPTQYDIEGISLVLYPRNNVAGNKLLVKYRPDFEHITKTEENLALGVPGISDDMLDSAIYKTCGLLKLMDEDNYAFDKFNALFQAKEDSIAKVRPGIYNVNESGRAEVTR